jgi:lysophospholipase L1-like esterase
VVESVLTDVRQGDAHIVATAGGRAAHRVGTGGAKASTFGRDNTALVTGLVQAPVKVFEMFGVNDMQLAVNVATFQADVQTMLVNLRAGLPSAKIYCRGILNVASSISNSAQRGAYNAAKAAAVAAIGDSNIVFISTDGWINPATDTYDGLHPNAAGYAKIAAAQLLVM